MRFVGSYNTVSVSVLLKLTFAKIDENTECLQFFSGIKKPPLGDGFSNLHTEMLIFCFRVLQLLFQAVQESGSIKFAYV